MPFISASDAFELHPDVRSYGPSTLISRVGRAAAAREEADPAAGDFAAATEALTTTRELLTRAARTTRERARGRGLALYVLRAERLAAMALVASDAMRATTR